METQKRLKAYLDEMNEKINVEKQNAEKSYEERLKENLEKVRRKSQKNFLK